MLAPDRGTGDPPTVWTDRHTMGWAQTVVPVLIHLKDPSWFPHQKQYPLRPEVKERD
jgi:hypothetical protein